MRIPEWIMPKAEVPRGNRASLRSTHAVSLWEDKTNEMLPIYGQVISGDSPKSHQQYPSICEARVSFVAPPQINWQPQTKKGVPFLFWGVRSVGLVLILSYFLLAVGGC